MRLPNRTLHFLVKHALSKHRFVFSLREGAEVDEVAVAFGAAVTTCDVFRLSAAVLQC